MDRPGATFKVDPNPLSRDVEKRFRYNSRITDIRRDFPGQRPEIVPRPYVPALTDEEREAVGEFDRDMQVDYLQPDTSDRIIVPGTYRPALEHPSPSVEKYGQGLVGGSIDLVLDELYREKARRGAGMCGASGRVVLSGVPTPTGGGQYTLQAITFPDTDWKTSSSLRWLRSNGIKPIKKADHTGSLYRYRIVDPKGFTKYYTSELMSRGRKINMVYGKP